MLVARLLGIVAAPTQALAAMRSTASMASSSVAGI
jgi:hypothetical protein